MSKIDNVFVINLEDKKDRWENVLSQIPLSLKSKTSRFIALTDESPTFKSKKSRYCDLFCTKGMKGCGSSHLAIWQKMVDENIQTAMILEDDAVFKSDFENLLNQMWQYVPQDWEMILLGCVLKCDLRKNYGLIEKLHSLIFPLSQNQEVNDHVYRLRNFLGTHAYIITKQGAQKLLEGIKIKTGHIDLDISNYLSTNDDFHAYVFSTDLISQDLILQQSSINSQKAPYIVNSFLDKITFDNGRGEGKISLAYVANEQIGYMKSLQLYFNFLNFVFFFFGIATGLWVKNEGVTKWIAIALLVEYLFSIRFGFTKRDVKTYAVIILLYVLGYKMAKEFRK